jgi:hypothetical protein
MPTILIVEKTGAIKELIIKTYAEDELYKKAGFKTKEGFKCYTTWAATIEDTDYNISLYGKTSGKANQENKYEFPPPVDTTLFFGSCILVNKNGSENLSEKEWNLVYDYLYGGFEDLDDDDDDDDEDEEDDLIGVKLTKEGYMKDDFIVDDDDEDEEDDDDDDYCDDEDDVVVKKCKKTSSKSKKVTKKDSVKALIIQDIIEENYLDCTDELEEEEYVK